MRGTVPVIRVAELGNWKDERRRHYQHQQQKDWKRHPLPGSFSTATRKLLVVTVTLPLILPTVLTALTSHLLNVRNWTGDLLQHYYQVVSSLCNDDNFNIYVWGTSVVGYICYWLPGLFFVIMDITGRPSILQQYKIQPGTNQPVNLISLIKCVCTVHFNQIVISFPVLCLSYYVMIMRGADFSTNLPSLSTTLLHLAVMVVVEDIGFYYLHRLFHHGSLYRRFHKLHHTWQSPIGIVAAYAHPFEHLVVNVLPILAGSLILGSHPVCLWLFVSLASVVTVIHHSGYNLPFLPSPLYHDYHHLKFHESYGVSGILDYLHGTDLTYRHTHS